MGIGSDRDQTGFFPFPPLKNGGKQFGGCMGGNLIEKGKEIMRKTFIFLSVLAIAVLVFGMGCTPKEQAKEQGKRGESLFKQHCSVCHPDGGNNVNPQKTLHKKDRETNGVKTAADIVNKMRNPGPGMTKFDEKTVPDKDAKEIAEYVLATFN